MNSNHILLVFPELGLNPEKPDRPPLGLLTIAGPLLDRGYAVSILDERAEDDFEKKLFKELEKDPICVGISSMSGHHIRNALRISKTIKEKSIAPIVFGGVQASIAPESIIKHPLVDIIVIDDGEVTLLKITEALANQRCLSNIPGIAYKQNNEIIFTDAPIPVDIQINPLIPFHLIDFDKYEVTQNWSWVSDKNIIPMETSRGCPYSCSFCTESVRKKKWRALTPNQVIEQIKYYQNAYSINDFTFIDDNFFGNSKRAEKILDLMIEEDIHIGWYTNIRSDFLARANDSLLEKIVISGCRMLTFGAESGSARILEMINKEASIEDILVANRKLSKFDIIPHYVTIRGFPTETKKDLIDTFLLNIRLFFDNDNAIFDMPHLIPTPGTRIARECLGKETDGYSLEDWAKIFDLEYYDKSQWIKDETYHLMLNTNEIVHFLWQGRFRKSPIKKLYQKVILHMIRLSHNLGSSAFVNRLLKYDRKFSKML